MKTREETGGTRGAGPTRGKRASKALPDSQTKYDTLMEQAGDAFFVHDRSGRILDVNRKACESLGYTREKLLTKTIQELDPDVLGPDTRDLWDQVMAGEQFTLETHHRRKDGSTIPVEITLGPLSLPGGQVFLAIVRDITQRKQQEQAYSQLIDAMNETAFVIGFNKKYLDVNKRAVETLGYSRAELLAMGPQDIDAYLGPDEFENLLTEMRSSKRQVFETQHRTKDGRIIPVEISSSLVSYQGKPAVLCVARDIAERKRAEETLRTLTSRHEAMLRTIPDIIAEVDANKTYTWVNDAGRQFFGDDVIGKEASYYFEGEQDTYARVGPLFDGNTDVYYVESWQRCRDGEKRLLAWWCRSLKDNDGDVIGALSTARDITERRRTVMMTEARLRLLELATASTLEGFLRATLDELETLTDSQIGFCNFMEADQENLRAAAWSTRTLEEYCEAGREGLHLRVSEAGVWADCIRQRRPVVHNDYAALPNRKGLPPGHAALARELVVPVLRGHRVVAVFAVGNKPRDYTEQDVETVSSLADLAWDIAARKQAETALKESEARNRQMFDASPDAVFMLDSTGRFLDCNQTAVDRYGYARDKILQMTALDLGTPGLREQAPDHLKQASETGATFEWRHRRKDGSELPVEIRAVPITVGTERSILSTVRDISERKQAEEALRRSEEQLRQSQKMESVGRLAGGVAHDFNNMLGVILGHAELAMEQSDPGQPVFANLQEICKAATRSAGITQQLLAFARRQVAAPMMLDLNKSLEGMLDMLRRLVGEDIELSWQPGSDLGSVEMDTSQLDQILVNLCVNARDAITGTGKVTIETATASLGEAFCAEHEGCAPGDYVRLTVRDNGGGMAEEALEHLFEPFFTTKETGKGTGLGLATVYGIVKQNNGFLDVGSEPGQGATVDIYLPRRLGAPNEERRETPTEASQGAGETLLVVEDERSVLRLTERILANLNYRVLTAQGPVEALLLAESHPGDIALLITDVVMPRMNGWELSERLRALRPDLKTLFVSGYAAEAISSRGLLDKDVLLLQKPFRAQDLATRVRAALGRE